LYGQLQQGLFAGNDMPTEAQGRTARAVANVENHDVNDLLTRDLDILVDEFTEPFEPATIRWDEVTSTEPQQVKVRGDQGPFGRSVTRSMAQCVLKAPLDGEAAMLTFRSHSGAPMGTVEGSARPGHVTFTWIGELDASPDTIMSWLSNRRAEVDRFLAYVNGDAVPLNRQMRDGIRSLIERRRDQELKRRSLALNLPFPVERQSESAVPIRVQRRTVRLDARPKTPTFAPEPELATENYEDILRDCAAMATILERMPVDGLGEEQLRNLILGMLNTNYTGQVAGELFNGAGKTDICIRGGDRNLFIGECKFYKGPVSVTKAIDQLLGYVVWRDTKAALLLFVQGGNFTDVVTKAVEAVATHPQCRRRAAPGEPSRRSDFVFTRADDDARAIHLALLPFRLQTQTPQLLRPPV
jgi:hypothetical protein